MSIQKHIKIYKNWSVTGKLKRVKMFSETEFESTIPEQRVMWLRMSDRDRRRWNLSSGVRSIEWTPPRKTASCRSSPTAFRQPGRIRKNNTVTYFNLQLKKQLKYSHVLLFPVLRFDMDMVCLHQIGNFFITAHYSVVLLAKSFLSITSKNVPWNSVA